jgi:hypothetical protein
VCSHRNSDMNVHNCTTENKRLIAVRSEDSRTGRLSPSSGSVVISDNDWYEKYMCIDVDEVPRWVHNSPTLDNVLSQLDPLYILLCFLQVHLNKPMFVWPIHSLTLSSNRSSWLQIQKSGFDSRSYQIFWEVVGLERGPLSLVSTTEELLEKKKVAAPVYKPEITAIGDPSRWPRDTLYRQKLALISLTSGGFWVCSHEGFSPIYR